MTPCDTCIENECEVNGYVCPLYKKYQDFGKNILRNFFDGVKGSMSEERRRQKEAEMSRLPKEEENG